MSGLKKHKDLVNIHRIHCFVYADAATRNAAAGLVVSDEGKIARQSDNETWWVLYDASVDGSPVWKELTNDTVPPALDVKVSITSNDTTAEFLDDSVQTGVGTNATSPLETSVVNPSANEKLKFQFDESKIDHNNLINSGGNQHIDWTAASAGTIDPSNYVDNNDDEKVKVSPNDTTPGYLFSDKIIAGSNITLDEVGDGGNEQLRINSAAVITGDVATVQAERTTSQSITLSYADISYDTTHEETLPSALEHNNTLTDRFDIKETGQYLISYTHQCDLAGSTVGYDFRVRVNDSTVIAQSEMMMSHEDDVDPVCHTFNAQLSNNDYISFQIRQTSGGHVSSTLEKSHVSIIALRGPKGDTGPTGAGSNIIAQKDDVTVGTVTSTLNFEGGGVTSVVDDGSNKTTVTIAGGSGDFSNGGEAGGANRSLGNTDNFDLAFLTNNLERLVIHENGCLQGDTSITGYLLDFHNQIASGGNGLILKAGEVAGDIVLHLADRDDTFQILEIEADQGHITHGKTYAQTLSDNGVVYGYDNQRTGDAADINTENGHYRIGGQAVIYGTEFDDAESDGESSTTSTTEQTKVTLTTGSLPSGKYRVGWYFETNGSSGSQDVEAQVYDGATVLSRVEEAAEDSDAWKSEGGFKYLSSISGVRTLTIKYKTQNSSATARIRRARLEIWRIS